MDQCTFSNRRGNGLVQNFTNKRLSYVKRRKLQLHFKSRRPKTWDWTFRGKGAPTGYLYSDQRSFGGRSFKLVLKVPINLEITSGHDAQHPDLVLAAFTERDSWHYLAFCCNPQLLFNNRSKKTDPPENANIPSRRRCSNKYVNAPRKQRQPKTRPAEASVRGGILLIISSLETNRSFELQILSFSSESLKGLNSMILLALAAHLPTCTFGEQNRKI